MSKLPNELLIKVTEVLAGDKPTLKQLSLASPLLYDATRQYLFDKVPLTKSLEDTVARLEVISKPHLVKWIQTVHLESGAIIPKDVEREHTVFLVDFLARDAFITQFWQTMQHFLDSARANIMEICFNIDVIKGFYTEDSEIHRAAINTVLEIIFEEIDLSALRCLKFKIGRRSYFDGIFNRFFNSRSINDSNGMHFTANLNRIRELEVDCKDVDSGWHPSMGNDDFTKFLSLTAEAMPSITKLHLSLYSIDQPLDISILRTLPLLNLSLDGMYVSNLGHILRNTPNLKTLSLSLVSLGEEPSEVEEEKYRWADLFKLLENLTITQLHLDNLGYDENQDYINQQKENTLICTGFDDDISAANSMFVSLIGKSSQITQSYPAIELSIPNRHGHLGEDVVPQFVFNTQSVWTDDFGWY